MLRIGDFLTLEIQEGTRLEKFRSKVADLDEESLYIEYPVNLRTNRTSFLMIGTNMQVSFTRDDSSYLFFTEVTGRVKRELPLLQLKRPGDDEIHRIQRREFVRIKWPVDIAVHPIRNEFSPFCTVTDDISAGGLSFYAPASVPLAENDPFISWIVLPLQSGYQYLKLKSAVVRTERARENANLLSAQFLEKTAQEEQHLMRFVFEVQLALRQKETRFRV
ncbi:MAG: pilus assembly protein PilZ [Caldibacillus debilis]|uniref:Pilus assembly protein PilZ n=1 Tax=Caldibacillus debilis TaxID=301148 RepID=A0A3E0K1T7_9BACI|nr:flagellar brake domain-containing protein [Caldibacillus debilis]REJ26925.1 MAG: pilus assembly protein PilZ [Caldibacillus debilis]REJ30575.1 MAG: pilus assembly protein PilZ [Caldibacillus debilis]